MLIVPNAHDASIAQRNVRPARTVDQAVADSGSRSPLRRFFPPSRPAARSGLAPGRPALATVIGADVLPGTAAAQPWLARLRELVIRRSLLVSVVAVALVLLALVEIRTSAVQALVLSQAARVLTYRVAPGPSPSVTYPQTGPYDVRLGYTRLPDFVDRLEAGGYRVEQQAPPSTPLAHLAPWGLYPPSPEKTRARLQALDPQGHPLSATRYPEQGYDPFAPGPPPPI